MNHELKSEIDGVIIDLILEHFNIQSLNGKRKLLTAEEFDEIVNKSEKIFYKKVLQTRKAGKA